MDADPTKTEHFRQRATNRKGEPARCIVAAQLDGVAVSLAQASGESTQFPGQGGRRGGTLT